MSTLIDLDELLSHITHVKDADTGKIVAPFVLKINVDELESIPTVDAITMEQINKYVIEINQILEEEKDDARWCAGLRYSLRVLDKYCGKGQINE